MERTEKTDPRDRRGRIAKGEKKKKIYRISNNPTERKKEFLLLQGSFQKDGTIARLGTAAARAGGHQTKDQDST